MGRRGLVDGTNLTFDPPQEGAPAHIDRGQVREWSGPGPFVARSQDAQHPFYIATYMTGANPFASSWPWHFDGQGDPEWVNVIPPAQYLESYTLFADPTYPFTWLVVVRRQVEGESPADVTLDCLGPIGGWSAFGGYEFADVALETGKFVDVGECSTGVHSLKSARPFGVTVWGWGSPLTDPPTGYVSYAYLGGASVRPINQVEIPR